MSRTMVNIRKKKSNKMKTLKKKYEKLWKESQRPSPHSPFMFEEDIPTESPTHMETPASSSNEGSEVRTRPSVTTDTLNYRPDLPPFSPRIFPLQEEPGPHPPLVFEEDIPTESPTHMETPASSSDEGSEVRTRPSTITNMLNKIRQDLPPFPPKTFPLPSSPLPAIPEVGVRTSLT